MRVEMVKHLCCECCSKPNVANSSWTSQFDASELRQTVMFYRPAARIRRVGAAEKTSVQTVSIRCIFISVNAWCRVHVLIFKLVVESRIKRINTASILSNRISSRKTVSMNMCWWKFVQNCPPFHGHFIEYSKHFWWDTRTFYNTIDLISTQPFRIRCLHLTMWCECCPKLVAKHSEK